MINGVCAGLGQVHNKVLAYTEDKQSLPAEVLQTAGDYLELASYEEAAGMSQERLQQAEEISAVGFACLSAGGYYAQIAAAGSKTCNAAL